MALTLSGRLYDPFGNALENAGVRFRAARTSTQILANYSAGTETDSSGDYTITVRYGVYHIEARQSARDPWYTIARNIPVTTETTSTDINALIVAYVGAGDATPEIVLEIEAITAEASAAAARAEAAAEAVGDPNTLSVDTETGSQGLADALNWRVSAVSVSAFGVDITGSQDSAAQMNAARDYCFANNLELFAPKNAVIRIDSPINLRRIMLDIRGQIAPTFSNEPQVVIGGRAGEGNNPPQYVASVLSSDTSSPSSPNIRVIGAKGQRISVDRTYYLQVWADTEVDADLDQSSAYSDFNLKYVDQIELASNTETTGSDVQWINENVFNLKRCGGFKIDGTYTHNNNRVYGGAFENGSIIDIVRGSNNRFYDIRLENGGKVQFGELARDNSVEYTWTSSVPARPADMINFDAGLRNLVYNVEARATTSTTLVALTADDAEAGAAAPRGVSNISQNGGLLSVAASKVFYDSSIIPLSRATVVRIKSDGVVSGSLRVKISGYDASGTLITTSTDNDFSGIGIGSLSFSGSQGHIPSANTYTGMVLYPTALGLDKASFIRISLQAGSGGLECVRCGVWVDCQAHWGGARNEDVSAAVSSEISGVGRQAAAGVTFSSTTILAGATKDYTYSWSGISANTPVTTSYGVGTAPPAWLICQAYTVTDNQVTVRLTNLSDADQVIPSGLWVYMVRQDQAQDAVGLSLV